MERIEGEYLHLIKEQNKKLTEMVEMLLEEIGQLEQDRDRYKKYWTDRLIKTAPSPYPLYGTGNPIKPSKPMCSSCGGYEK